MPTTSRMIQRSSVPSLLRHFVERVLLITLEFEKIIVILPKSVSVTDSDQRDALLLHVSVEVTFNVNADCTRALVENSILWLVVDQATHCHPLLLATTQHIIPVVLSVPAAFSCNEVLEADLAEESGEFVV